MGPAHLVTLQDRKPLSGGRVVLPNVTQISDTADNAAASGLTCRRCWKDHPDALTVRHTQNSLWSEIGVRV
ncbi:MAG: hypothetical protein R3C99_15010 [Pirellulaceae bacterium]